MPSIPFEYHPDIPLRFPLLAGVAILGNHLANQSSPAGLLGMYHGEQEVVLHRLGASPLSDQPALAGWRAAFRKFGVDPTQYRCAAEALLRRLTKKGDIPSINAIVDCCNLISIRYAMPVAAIDLRQVTGTVTVHFADGSEHFNPLGEDQPGPPEPGEVIFSDEKELVLARRWCWRQCVESAAGLETTRVLITIESQDTSGQSVIEQAARELCDLLQQFVGGEYQSQRII